MLWRIYLSVLLLFSCNTFAAKPLPIFDSSALLNDVAKFSASKQQKISAKSTTAKKNHRLFIIMIDAGHGGKDPGAEGINGIQEKNVALSIAKSLAKKINQQPNMRAYLTRDGDYFLSLRERLKRARAVNADIFIAIHADAYFNAVASGASVYALSKRGATSEAARWLAQRDRYTALDEVDLNRLHDRSPMLRSVLIDLAQTATVQDSIRLGNSLLKALEPISPLHYKQTEQAPFVVLKSPDIPSILVETGFLSHPADAKRLANKAYQQKIAEALCLGIKRYQRRYGLTSQDELS